MFTTHNLHNGSIQLFTIKMFQTLFICKIHNESSYTERNEVVKVRVDLFVKINLHQYTINSYAMYMQCL